MLKHWNWRKEEIALKSSISTAHDGEIYWIDFLGFFEGQERFKENKLGSVSDATLRIFSVLYWSKQGTFKL